MSVDSVIRDLGSTRTSDLLQYSDFIALVTPRVEALIRAAGGGAQALPDAVSLVVNLSEQYFSPRSGDEKRGPLKRRAVHAILRLQLGAAYNEEAVDRQIEFLLGMNVVQRVGCFRLAWLGLSKKMRSLIGIEFA